MRLLLIGTSTSVVAAAVVVVSSSCIRVGHNGYKPLLLATIMSLQGRSATDLWHTLCTV